MLEGLQSEQATLSRDASRSPGKKVTSHCSPTSNDKKPTSGPVHLWVAPSPRRPRPAGKAPPPTAAAAPGRPLPQLVSSQRTPWPRRGRTPSSGGTWPARAPVLQKQHAARHTAQTPATAPSPESPRAFPPLRPSPVHTGQLGFPGEPTVTHEVYNCTLEP